MTFDQKLEQVCRKFRIEGTWLGYRAICVGHINKTYEVRFQLPEGGTKSYLVQNVNTYAFKNPVELMDNIDQVTEHIRRKNPGHTNLHFHHTEEHRIYLEDGENFWRLTNYIPSVVYNTVSDRRVVLNAGRAFGEFQVQLSDFDSTKLHETIPDFHNTKERYRQLERAIAADPLGKVADVRPEIAYLMEVRDTACRLTDMKDRGLLPLRVTHNDTKINNVLFNPDDQTAEVVIDLDTVMPGLVGNDFGDAVRFAANTAEEDCPDSTQAHIDLDIYEAFAEGFLEKTADTLTQNEKDTLALSCVSLTLEVCTRFLADYILGSPYFHIDYPEHNLVRARCQMALAQDILCHMPEMEEIIRKCASDR